ncbi:MAG: NAD-binding protein [Desulfosarcina sp.]|jgi:voltage-gated potassium channel
MGREPNESTFLKRPNQREAGINWSKARDAVATFFQWQRPKLDIQPGQELNELLVRVRPPAIVLILVLTSGTMGYMAIDDYSPLNAFYMTVITIATVGFGEIQQVSEHGRLFTIMLIFAGIGSFGYSIGVFVSIISEGALHKVLGERNMIKQIGYLEKHFIICCLNETSIEISKQCRKKQMPFVLVDDSADLEKTARNLKLEYYISGEPYNDVSLKKAHISTCGGVIAASPNDNDNFAIVVSARILMEDFGNRDARIISIARDRENKEKLLKIGADYVITPQIITGQRLFSYVIKPDAASFMDDVVYSDKTDVGLEELEVNENSWMTGLPIKDLSLREYGLMIIAIKRGKEVITQVRANLLINGGDILLMIGKAKQLHRYLKKKQAVE